MAKGKGKSKKVKGMEQAQNDLNKEYALKEAEIKGYFVDWERPKGKFSESQIAELTLMYKVYQHKAYLDTLKEKGVQTGFAFLGYCLGLTYPKSLDYTSSEKEVKGSKQGRPIYDRVKAYQAYLNRTWQAMGLKDKSKSKPGKLVDGPTRLYRQAIKLKVSEIKSLINSLTVFLAKIEQEKGKDKASQGQGQGQGQGQLAA
jgi:hypothetical protein